MNALNDVRRAIQDPGRSPSHHREVMARHRREWPTLWAALDRLIADRRQVWPDLDQRLDLRSTLGVGEFYPIALSETEGLQEGDKVWAMNDSGSGIGATYIGLVDGRYVIMVP